jgi:S-DNA-T family DNA segregation ATPase FtsK/SpoIIIE
VIRKEIAREILVIMIALVTLFALLSLLTFHPADWPSPAQVPMNAKVNNLCGIVGSTFAYFLFAYVGVFASYGLVIIAAAWGIIIFMHRKFETPWVKILGCFLFLISLSTLERLLIPDNFFYGRLTGGYAGTYLAEAILLNQFNFTGAMLIAGAFTLVSIPLATDLLLYDLVKSALEHYRAWQEKRAEARAQAEKSTPSKPALALATATAGPKTYVGPDESVLKASKRSGVLEKQRETEEDAKETEPAKEKKKKSERRKKPARKPRRLTRGNAPSIDLLQQPVARDSEADAEFIQRCTEIIEGTLANFKIRAGVKTHLRGPVITQFEIKLAPGISGAQVRRREDDLAIALGVPSVRVDFPLPGRTTVGIQVPNPERDLIVLRDVMDFRDSEVRSMTLPIFLGKDIYGNKMMTDLARMPHLLVAGTTGSGKSICLNSVMLSLLMRFSPDEVKFIIVDPKRVELTVYENLPHLMHPIVDDCGKAFAVFEWAVKKMYERFDQMKRVGVKDIAEFNKQGKEKIYARLDEAEKHGFPYFMPYIVIVVDELAEMVMYDREAETPLIRVAQLARAVGIHLVLATQKPHSNVISTNLKSNMPARIAFNVTSGVDSRTILDESGAEKLLGKGDMLFRHPEQSYIARGQGCWVSPEDCKTVIEHLQKTYVDPDYDEELVNFEGSKAMEMAPGAEDVKMRGGSLEDVAQAGDIIVAYGSGSVTHLQRKMGCGFNRASDLMDRLTEVGLVGAHRGGKPRELLMDVEAWDNFKAQFNE